MARNEEPLPCYNREQSYSWNFEHAPQRLPHVEVPQVAGDWNYCGLPINSPLGIAAGPLLNGAWLRYYAALGFDVLTYKTVRTQSRECYPLPNLVPVSSSLMKGQTDSLKRAHEWQGSWAVSFGMPSQEVSYWSEDIRRTKSELRPGQLLSVSVVGTMQPKWRLDDLARDYAACARLAFAANADSVEMNFSCPNVCSQDGQLFQVPNDAAQVARTVREVVGADRPLLVKIGFLPDDSLLEELLIGLDVSVNAVVTTNSLRSRVVDAAGELLFAGEQRGICGRATRAASVDQVARCRRVIDRRRLHLLVIGVGGIETASHVRDYLDAGANSVQLATAVMVDPQVGLKIREELSSSGLST